jgi:hypothetical protein
MSGPLGRSHGIRFLTNVLLTKTRFTWRRFRSRWPINSMALVSLLLATVCVMTVGLLLQAVLYSDLPIPNPSGLVAVCPSDSRELYCQPTHNRFLRGRFEKGT